VLDAGKGQSFILVLLPHKEQFSNDFNASRMRWQAFAGRNSLPVIDIYDALAENHEELYFPLDGHLNPKGNEKVASVIVSDIRKRNP
jgi:lysophospholipase L1-like esterase